MTARFVPYAFVLSGLTGCASYQAMPLDLHPPMQDKVPHITVDSRTLPLPELRAHRYDPGDGLDMTDVAILAVVRNPDLKAARDDAHIAYAQAFAAGLLPEPLVTSEVDQPGPRVPGADTHAFNVGLSWDVGSLLYASKQHRAARLTASQTDLNLLWQEWQVVSQARILFSQNVADRQLLKFEQEAQDILKSRYEHTKDALSRGLITADIVVTDLTALAAAQSQIHSTEIDFNAKHAQLAALLDLSPSVELNLVGQAQLPILDDTKIRSILPDLGIRRPDLLALRDGYESQDQTYRAAILQQFPDITIGLNRQRDSSNVYSTGFVVNFAIPINRNRGNIAVALATRQKLHDSYESRYGAAQREVLSILADMPVLQQQLNDAKAALSELNEASIQGRSAFNAGDFDELAYDNLQSVLLAKRVEVRNIEESILEKDILLQTLIGSDIPVKITRQE